MRPWFAGPGTGLRWRLTEHLDAVAALDVQLAFRHFFQDGAFFTDRGYNLDANLGMAAVF